MGDEHKYTNEEEKKVLSTTIPNLPIAKDNSVQFQYIHIDSIRYTCDRAMNEKETETEQATERAHTHV